MLPQPAPSNSPYIFGDFGEDRAVRLPEGLSVGDNDRFTFGDAPDGLPEHAPPPELDAQEASGNATINTEDPTLSLGQPQEDGNSGVTRPREIDVDDEEQHGAPPPEAGVGYLLTDAPPGYRYALAFLLYAWVTRKVLRARVRRAAAGWAIGSVLYFAWYAFRRDTTDVEVLDLEEELSSECARARVDAELVAYLRLTNAFNRRTARNVQELARRAAAWMAQNRRNWSQAVRYSQMCKAVTIAFKRTSGESTALSTWSRWGTLDAIFGIDAFSRTGALGWLGRTLPLA